LIPDLHWIPQLFQVAQEVWSFDLALRQPREHTQRLAVFGDGNALAWFESFGSLAELVLEFARREFLHVRQYV